MKSINRIMASTHLNLGKELGARFAPASQQSAVIF